MTRYTERWEWSAAIAELVNPPLCCVKVNEICSYELRLRQRATEEDVLLGKPAKNVNDWPGDSAAAIQ